LFADVIVTPAILPVASIRQNAFPAFGFATSPELSSTARAIDLAIVERTGGPLFRAADGKRLDRHGAARIVRRVTRRAGISKQVSRTRCDTRSSPPHSTPESRLGDVQEAASDADPRTTMRYDRARTSLDRHATYIVATYIARAAR
jgi:integrase/recombinase XerD